MRILEIGSTERFVGPVDRPHQIVRATIDGTGPVTARVEGREVRCPAPVEVLLDGPGRPHELEIPVETPGRPAGERLAAEVVLAVGGQDGPRRGFELEVGEPGWRMFMVSHFHYDPVWWNTQASYTETWEKLPREERPWEGRKQQPAFTLIEAHLDVARRDPDYRFVLAELDYLKPYWDTFPWRRAELRQLLHDGRLELMGGTYNEPNTNLTSAESTARNAVYGIGYQRHVLGGDPATAWQLDVFGHDPQFPGMMADAGLTSSSWARGPFHQWGPSRSPGGNPAMQFASEFDWVSPSGRGLLTSYMPNHYSAGWELDNAADLADAVTHAERLFHELRAVAATRNVLLPVGSDYTPPNRWMTAIARWWNARYTWPRFEVGLPRDFFAAVREELATTGRRLPPQSRDMNPVYSGKDVSYIDTKQAQRAGETALLAAERFGAVAALLGASYPDEALDKAWRQLLFGAHHDGITGTESDQVYLDLLGGWRDTYELASHALDDALDHLGSRITAPGAGAAIAVFNALAWDRTDVARCRVTIDDPGDGVTLLDERGDPVPFVIEGVEHDEHGRVREVALAFVARDVPSVGYRTYQLLPADEPLAEAGWQPVPAATIANRSYEVSVDAERGGAISSWLDRRTGAQLLAPDGLANEVLAVTEYPTHPQHGEGPWHLTPTGRSTSSSAQPADRVRRERSAIGERLVVDARLDGCMLTQTVSLYDGVDRVVCTTDLDGFDGQDTLFRVRVAADVPGGLPLSEVADAVIGRGAGFPDVDVAEVPSTLDNPANTWFAVGTTARLELASAPEGPVTASRAISVAEVVAPDDDAAAGEGARELVVALVRSGVTSTVSTGGGPRYGSIDTDSNLPDVRIAVGGPEENAFTRAVFDAADVGYGDEFHRQLETVGSASVYVPASRPLRERWRPNADLRGPRDLPVLIVAGRDPAATARVLRRVARDLERAASYRIEQPEHLHVGEGDAADRTVGIVNVGLPGFNVDIDGRLHLSLMRSCSGWPSGVWLDPPRRTAPDGSSFQFQHWTHRFEYALVGGLGDWRALGLVRAGHDHNEPLRARQLPATGDDLPPSASFLRLHGDGVALGTLKPAGNPMAAMGDPRTDPAEGITVRCYETHGRAATARLKLFRPLRGAWRADLLERATSPLPCDDDGVVLELDGYEIATVRLETDEPSRRHGPALGRRREPAQPVFGDSWLHNKGAAPIGYQPVTARIVERAVAGPGPFELQVAVASERTDASNAGRLTLDVPAGWRAEPRTHTYHLAPGAHELVPVRVTPAADADPGRWFVAVQLEDEQGQVHEDVATVDLGPGTTTPTTPPGRRVLHLERATRKAAVVHEPAGRADVAVIGGELTAELCTDHLDVPAGGHERLTVRLTNHVAGPIRGEIQLISPWGTWDATGPWTQGFSVGGEATAEVGFDVCCPLGTPPTSSWALVKVMYFGRLLYTPSIPLGLGHWPAGTGT
jgi:alpha-mannosidase